MWKYNKGEWSELYVFAYLLSRGKLYLADKDLNQINNKYFQILEKKTKITLLHISMIIKRLVF